MTPEQRRLVKRDRRCAVVVLGAIASMLLAVVIWLLLLTAGRGSPVYGLLMIPFVFWAIQLASYTPWTIRWLRTAQIAAPVVSALGVVFAVWSHSHAANMAAELFGYSVAPTVVSIALLRGSLLARVAGRIK